MENLLFLGVPILKHITVIFGSESINSKIYPFFFTERIFIGILYNSSVRSMKGIKIL